MPAAVVSCYRKPVLSGGEARSSATGADGWNHLTESATGPQSNQSRASPVRAMAPNAAAHSRFGRRALPRSRHPSHPSPHADKLGVPGAPVYLNP